MKRFNHITLVLVMCTLLAHRTSAQKSRFPQLPDQPSDSLPVFSGALKTNPLSMLFGTVPGTAEYRLSYQIVNSQKQASELSFSYLGRGLILKLIEQDSMYKNMNIHFVVRGFRFQAEQRFYFPSISRQFMSDARYAPIGFYIAPHMSYAFTRFSSKYYNVYDIYIAVSQFNVNLKSGLQFKLFSRFTLDVFGGLGYKKNTWAQHYSSTNIQRIPMDDFPLVYSGHVKIMLGFNLGWLF